MTFDEAFERVVGHEGGYVNDPSDPGGETNWGISKRSYPDVDIKALTRDEAKAIYKRDFWDRVNFGLPAIVTFHLFDFAVHSGVETAVRHLQHALGLADDGVWGTVSRMEATTKTPQQLIMIINAERLDFMTRLKNWPSASRGWARRIAGNLRHGAEDS